MDTALEIKGLWWLPTCPENKKAGILRYAPTEYSTLEIIGELQDNDWLLFNQEDLKRIGTIWGLSAQAEPISLFLCSPIDGTKNTSCPFPLVKYRTQVIFKGKHLQTVDDVGQYEVQAQYDELSVWYHPNNVQIIPTHRKILFIERNLKYDIVTRVNDKMQFVLTPKVTIKPSLTSTEIIQDTELHIQFDGQTSLTEIVKTINSFNQFMSLATLSSVKCKKLYLIEGKETQIEVFYHYDREPYNPNMEFFNFLFTFDTIKEDYDKILRNWYSDDKLIPIRTHLIESFNRKGSFTSADFLVVIQAIDGFYTRFREDIRKLEKILKNLIVEFSDVSCIEFEDTDYEKVINSRDYYSHLLPPGKKTNVLSGRELHLLDFKLRKILLCCILKTIGFDNQAIDKICALSNNYALSMKTGKKKTTYTQEIQEIKCDVINKTVENKAIIEN